MIVPLSVMLSMKVVTLLRSFSNLPTENATQNGDNLSCGLLTVAEDVDQRQHRDAFQKERHALKSGLASVILSVHLLAENLLTEHFSATCQSGFVETSGDILPGRLDIVI